MSKDTRVLCKACADEYIKIGYKLRRTTTIKEECFICSKRGFEYEVNKPEQRGGKCGKGEI